MITRKRMVVGLGAMAALGVAFAWQGPATADERGGIDSWQPNMFVGPDRETNATKGCVNCHANEYQTWLSTHHNASLGMADTDLAKALKRGMRIRGPIQRAELCQNCHFTVVLNRAGQEDAKYGVTCESCHGPGKVSDERAWVNIHSDTERWPLSDPAKREERMRLAVDAGMVRPTQLYDLAENCFQCHVMAKDIEGLEQMVNTEYRGQSHAASTPGFELVAFSHGEVRHNFRSPSGTEDPANPKSDFIRGLYVVGKLLDLEYSVRGMSYATDAGGRYFNGIKARLEGDDGVLAKLRQIKDALGSHMVAQKVQEALDAVDASEFKVNNRANLQRIADQVQAAARFFNGKTPQELEHLEEELAPLESLLPAESAYRGAVQRP